MAEKKHNTNIATSEDFGDGLNMRTLADCTVRRLAFFESWLAYRGGQFISSHRVDETCLLLCVVNGRLLLAGFLTGPYTNLMVIENHLWNHIPHWEIKQDEYIRSPAYPLWLAAKYLHSRFHVELSSRFIVGDTIEISCCDERHWKEIDFELCYCRKDWCGIHALWNDDSVPKQDPPAAPEEIRKAVLGLRSFDMKTAEHWLKEALPGDFFRQPGYRVYPDPNVLILPWKEGSRQYCLGTFSYKGEDFALIYDFHRLFLCPDGRRQCRPLSEKNLAAVERKISKALRPYGATPDNVPPHIVHEAVDCVDMHCDRWGPMLYNRWRHRAEQESEMKWKLRKLAPTWNSYNPLLFRDHGAGVFGVWKLVFEKLPLALIFVCPDREQWSPNYVAALYHSQEEYYYARQGNYRGIEIFCVTVMPPDVDAPPPEMAESDDPHLQLCTLEEIETRVSAIIENFIQGMENN